MSMMSQFGAELLEDFGELLVFGLHWNSKAVVQIPAIECHRNGIDEHVSKIEGKQGNARFQFFTFFHLGCHQKEQSLLGWFFMLQII